MVYRKKTELHQQSLTLNQQNNAMKHNRDGPICGVSGENNNPRIDNDIGLTIRGRAPANYLIYYYLAGLLTPYWESNANFLAGQVQKNDQLMVPD